MLEVLGQAALRTLLLAAAVQLGIVLFRIQRPQLRLAAWTVVLAASLAMPTMQWVTPLRLSVLPDLPGTALTEAAAPHRHISASQASGPASVGEVTELTTAMPWLEVLYLLVSGILLLRLTVGIVLSLRLVGKAMPVHPDWAVGIHIRISQDIVAPVTVANVILLPPDAVGWPAAMREAVLAHERAHLARWDFALLVASQVNQAVFWFSPLSWWLHRRLAVLAELASDDQAMEATGDRPGYAQTLLEMGRRSGPLSRGLAMARPATLQYRIERVLSDRVPSNPALPFQQVLLALGAACLSIIAASSQRAAAPPFDSAPWPAMVPSEERGHLSSAAGLDPSPSAPTGQGVSEPMPVQDPRTESASQAPHHSVAAAWAARPSNLLTARGAVRLTPRPTSRNVLLPSPSRTMAQRIKLERDPSGRGVPLEAGAIVFASFARRSNDGHGMTNSIGAAGPDGRASLSVPTGQQPANEPRPLQRAVEPNCTGVYLPRPGGPRADGQDDLIQARYFEASDGMPWLRLSFGSRTQARLTGLEVERTSIRTTVVTTLPRGRSHMTGTTQGAHGTIDFECVRPGAPL